jgi:polysaccharide chain length determinant protein (PEP-CTERM system associated)
MTVEYELTFEDYIAILRRRWPFVLAVFLVVFFISTAVAILIPPVYRSTGTIIVEAQGIPDELVASTITSVADERIQLIKQRVMTRDNLLRIINKYDLYSDKRTQLTTSELISFMRSAIGVETIKASGQNRWSGAQTIAFSVFFEYGNPDLANKTANELVTLFLDENVKTRTQRATETTEFLTQEAEKLKSELEALEQRIATYKQENSHALPEHLDMRLSMIARAESDLRNIETEYKGVQEELRFLDIELAAAQSGLISDQIQGTTPARTDLASLNDEYLRIAARYTESHPDIRALKRKIEALGGVVPNIQNDNIQGESTFTDEMEITAEASDLAVNRVLAKIESAKARLDSLLAERLKLQNRIADNEKAVLLTPEVERGLTTLSRDHENARRKYEEIRAKQMSARISESLEGENKAERFTLLEPPLLPDRPIKPNRKKIMAMGLVLSIVGAVGILFLLESIDKRVRGSGSLTSILHDPPLVVIPYLSTNKEVQRKKRFIYGFVILIFSLLVLGLVIIHFLYMPLDILVLKIVSKFE